MWKKSIRALVCCFLVWNLQADTWNVNASGIWETGTNWITGVPPNSPTATVTFSNSITSATTIFLNSVNQAQSLTFDSPASYTIANSPGPTSAALTLGGTINFLSGSHTIQTDLNSTATITVNQSTTQDSFFSGNIITNTLSLQGTPAQIPDALSPSITKLVFSGTVNATAGITLNQSTMRLDTGGVLFSLATMDFQNNAGFEVATDFTLTNPILMSTGNMFLISNAGATLTVNAAITENTSTIFLLGPGTIDIPFGYFRTNVTELSDDVTVVIGDNISLGSGPITFRNGGTLTSATTRTISNPITSVNTAEISAAAGTEFTFNGIISGAGSLTLTGSGTKILNNSNTITGTVELAEGVSRMVSDSSFGTGPLVLNGGTVNITADRTLSNPISVNGNSFISADTATTLTIDGIITGAQDLNFTGNGTSILNQANTHSGTTTLTSGITAAGNDNAFGTSSISLNGGTLNNTSGDRTLNNTMSLDSDSVVSATGATTLTLNGVISGASNIDFTGGGTVALTATNTYAGNTSLGNVSVSINNTNSPFGTGAVTINGGDITAFNSVIDNNIVLDSIAVIEVLDIAGTLALNGIISGTNALTLQGPGTTTVSGSNTYSGATTIDGGSVVVANDNAFGAGNVSLNTTVLTNSGNRAIDNTIFLNTANTITADTGTTFTFDGVISGASSLTLNGDGTTVLNAFNTHAGPTTITSGTTVAGNDRAFGSGNVSLNGGNLANNKDVNIPNTFSLDSPTEINPATSTTLTLDGIISGNNTVNFNGPGTTVLNQANTYIGATTLSQGTTAAGNDAAFGTNNVSLNGGNLTNNANRTITNPISVNAPSAITTIASTTLTLDGIISGSNSLNFDGPGTTVLNQANTYAGPTTISSGTVAADNNTAFGTSDVTLDAATLTNNLIDRTLNNNFSVTSPSTIIPDVATTLTLNGTISGSGDITVASGGNLVLTGANTSSGAILLQNDDCSIDNNNGFGTSTVTFDGTSLTVSNPVTLNNPMVLNQDTTINPISDDLSLNGNITGSGMLTVSGTPGVRENLTLSGTNAYSGGTSLTDLTSSIVADANLGTGPLTLNSSTLNVDGTFSSTRNINVNTTTATEKSSVVVSANNVFTATGTLTGSDGFIKSGAGEFLIPGDQPGIAGTVSVTEGTLTIDGLLSNASLEATGVSIITGSGSAGDTSVTDALLKGNGSYASITMNSGTIAPGNSIGTITVTGNYIQNAGAVYEVELNSTTSDQIIVTGNATIQTGAILTVLEPLGTVLEGTTYDILIANNIDQLWSIVNIPTSVPLTLSLVEGNTIARLSAPTSRSFMNEFVENGNPRNTANYINAIEITENSDLQNLVMSIESDPDNLSGSLNQLHHARFGAFELINVESNYGIISTIDRHQAFFQCAKNCAERPNSVWVGLLGSTASRKQRKELRGSDNTDIGGILGYDYCFGNNVVLGISGGYLHTDLNWDKRGGNATSQKGFATVYGTYNNPRLQTMLCLMGGANFYDIHRRIAFADVDRTANSTNTGGFFSSNFGAKVDLLGTSNTIIAQGNIGYHYLYQDSFKETGANSVNLLIDPRTSHFLRSQLGLQLSGTAGTQEECIRYYVGGNWVNKSLLNDDNFSAKFLSFKNDSPVLKVRSNDETINGFLAEAGFEASINTNQISLTYQGEFDNNDQNHQVQGSLRFSF